jgi:hypothetical protein
MEIKVARLKRGLTVVANINFYNKSYEYINEFLKEKIPLWELLSIKIEHHE